MAQAVKPVPIGYSTVTPTLIVKGAASALDFYKKAFGAKELSRFTDPKGRIAHAEIQIGSSRLMLSEEYPEMQARGPQTLGGTPVSLMMYVEHVDELFHQALIAGAKEVQPVKDQFWGDRAGTVRDPYGHVWMVATRIEDLSNQELERRAAKAMSQQPSA